MTTKQKAYIALLTTSIVWGTTWVVSKIGVRHVPGLEIASIRQFIAGSILVCFYWRKGEKIPNSKTFLQLFIMALLMFVSANGVATLALKYIPSGLAALIAALYPLCVVIIERLVFRNAKITPLTFLGLVLGIGGIAVVFYESAFHQQPPGYLWGVFLSIIAMLSWSVGTIVIARNTLKMNPYYAVGWEMVISSCILFFMVQASGDHVSLNKIPVQTWAVIAYLAFAGSIIAFIAFIYTMNHLEPAIAALYAYINPIVAILVGSVAVNEKLTLNIFIGSVITMAGVFLVNRSMKKQKELMSTSDADAM
jgi:drug/metabolite transporter (DMT)-like permease